MTVNSNLNPNLNPDPITLNPTSPMVKAPANAPANMPANMPANAPGSPQLENQPQPPTVGPVYQGQFGQFTITPHDRREVLLYRTGLTIAALCLATGIGLLLWQGATFPVLRSLDWLYVGFCGAIGLSLLTIHIYLVQLHRLLQLFWAIGCLASLVLAFSQPDPLVLYVYQRPIALLGVGFIFAALTGIFFKEGFCFNRLETKLLTPLIPLLLLGHLSNLLPLKVEPILLTTWGILFLIFSGRKMFQAIPDDIGDKSVFNYLKQQQQDRQFT